jgi:hypothetical protein
MVSWAPPSTAKRAKSQDSDAGLGTCFISTSASAYSDVGSDTFTSMAPGAFNSVAAADGKRLCLLRGLLAGARAFGFIAAA